MVALSRRILMIFVKLGDHLGLWQSNNQVYIDIQGKTGRRLYAEWSITTEEYENAGR